jgi:hypothetical protein
MGTGILPREDDFDIDVALVFNSQTNDFLTPIALKNTVYTALNKQFQRDVQYKRHCIRVQYRKSNEPIFHVDFAIYAKDSSSWFNKSLCIAKGHPNSENAFKVWEPSDPKELVNKINSKFSGKESAQFKRIIRFLKAWKDYTFEDVNDNGTPTGISLTACAYQWFVPIFENDSCWDTGPIWPNDLKAMIDLVSKMEAQLSWSSQSISIHLPVTPYNNLFEKINKNKQHITIFQRRLLALKQALLEAQSAPNQVVAVSKLQSVFGSRFPRSV